MLHSREHETDLSSNEWVISTGDSVLDGEIESMLTYSVLTVDLTDIGLLLAQTVMISREMRSAMDCLTLASKLKGPFRTKTWHERTRN